MEGAKMLVFQRLDCGLFGLAGLIRGRLIEDDGTMTDIWNLEEVDSLFRELVSEDSSADVLTGEREKILAQGTLARDDSDLVEQLCSASIDDTGDMRGFSFKPCEEAECPLRRLVVIPHGRFTHNDVGGSVFHTIREGMSGILKGVEVEEITPSQGVRLIRQMREAGVPLHYADIKKTIDGLSEERKREIVKAAQQLDTAMTIVMFGFP